MSSLSLSPSGPGAVVPRSNRDVPLPVSGKRGKRDCMVCVTQKKTTGKSGKLFNVYLILAKQNTRYSTDQPLWRWHCVWGKVICWLQSVFQTATESQQGQDERGVVGLEVKREVGGRRGSKTQRQEEYRVK